ncbi:hypothetical protein HS088_TW10G00313 [Tripterygium wilfordii]|uniref:DUF538 family protein n=1 Tax=Tripterygium wilfordii TaxID=458696 RepID=A0A7J7D4N7_TRIWF|nr:uncharacterized protein LOC120007100 [Tripterygium wilfordii]KAF5741317.1 hypothetical protein HS088_TW10G00313 [Tripterygium wilfordii]
MVPVILLISLIFSLTISANSQSGESIYEVLRAHGLPMGLLPKGVKEFNVVDKGRFEVYLDQACNAKFESQLHYERNVSFSLSYGQIGALSGITAQELFLWFPVKGIRVDIPSSGLIYFDVGVVFKQFSLSLFESPRECLAVPAVDVKGIRDGMFLVEKVAKSQSGELRFQLDQESSVRDVL